MPLQATMTIGDKTTAVAATIVSGGATYPNPNQVRIVSILPAADQHRFADIHRAVKNCLDYARDNNLFVTSGSIAIVSNLDGGKSSIRQESIAANIVTGDVGIMVLGSVRNRGSINITENAHIQLLNWMNENDRLVN